MKDDLISIIIPVFNASKYLNACLDSVLAQTYQNYECLLINDGSTDNSKEICQKYANNDNRFRLINIENSGPATARNKGIDQSKGKYITFIDSDDWVHIQYLEYLYTLLNSNVADIASISHLKTNEQVADLAIDESNLRTISGFEALKTYDLDSYYLQSTVWGKLYRQELFENIRFNDGKLHEDISITYKLIYQSTRIATSNAVLYYYRKHSESITGTRDIKKQFDYYEAMLEKINFYSSIGLNNQSQKMVYDLIKKVYWKFSKFEENEVLASSNEVKSILKSLNYLARNTKSKKILYVFYNYTLINPMCIIKTLRYSSKFYASVANIFRK